MPASLLISESTAFKPWNSPYLLSYPFQLGDKGNKADLLTQEQIKTLNL